MEMGVFFLERGLKLEINYKLLPDGTEGSNAACKLIARPTGSLMKCWEEQG